MPNGKIGDHPFTDVVVHGRDTYSRRAAELIRAIDSLADDKTRNELANLLMLEYNDLLNPDVVRLERYLEDLHAKLLREAHDKGFEIRGP